MDALAQELGTPEAIGFASLMQGTSAYHCGRFTVAREHVFRAVQSLRGCSGVDWETDCAHIYAQLIASDTGMYSHLARTTPGLIVDALRRGRIWAAAMLTGYGVHAWLLPDNPTGYSTALAEAKRHWRGDAQLRWPDWVMLLGEWQQLVYQGRPIEAFQRFDGESERYARAEIMASLSSGGNGFAGYAAYHGKAAAAALNARPVDAAIATRARAVVRTSIAALRRYGGAKKLGIAAMLEGALALDRGDLPAANAQLVSAADILETIGAGMWAAAARRRAGQLVQGSEGAMLISLGDTFMQSQGVKNLDAMTEVNCPGCIGPGAR
jgi:hypothetical protein